MSLERVSMMPEKDSVSKFTSTEYRCCLLRPTRMKSVCRRCRKQKQQGPTTGATCYVVSVSRTREYDARKDSVLKFRCTEYRCCLVTSHEHNLLPFSTPQSHALLSTESEAADAVNNKERLGISNDLCGSVPFMSKKTSISLRKD